MQLPANRCLRQAFLTPALQVLAQQRDGPFDRLVAEVLRAPLEAGDEGDLEVFGPQAGVIAPALIGQSSRVACLFIALDPVINAHATSAEHAGNFGKGAPRSGFQDGQGAAEQSRIGGSVQLLLQSAALSVGQS